MAELWTVTGTRRNCLDCGEAFLSVIDPRVDGVVSESSTIQICANCTTARMDQWKRDSACWERKSRSTLERMKFLTLQFDSEEADDLKREITIIVQGRTDQPLYAHAFILSSKSTVFRSVFNTGIGTLRINDAPLNVMRAVIKFCYDGEVNFTTDITAECVLKVAHKYDILHLQKVCEEHLCSTITTKSLLHILKIGLIFDAEILKEAAKEFFKGNFETVYPVFMAAAEYQLKVTHNYNTRHLGQVFEQELSPTISRENLLEMFMIARIFDAKLLEEAAKAFFQKNFDDVFPGLIDEVIV